MKSCTLLLIGDPEGETFPTNCSKKKDEIKDTVSWTSRVCGREKSGSSMAGGEPGVTRLAALDEGYYRPAHDQNAEERASQRIN